MLKDWQCVFSSMVCCSANFLFGGFLRHHLLSFKQSDNGSLFCHQVAQAQLAGRRRGAISAEPISEEDASSYVKKVGLHQDLSLRLLIDAQIVWREKNPESQDFLSVSLHLDSAIHTKACVLALGRCTQSMPGKVTFKREILTLCPSDERKLCGLLTQLLISNELGVCKRTKCLHLLYSSMAAVDIQGQLPSSIISQRLVRLCSIRNYDSIVNCQIDVMS